MDILENIDRYLNESKDRDITTKEISDFKTNNKIGNNLGGTGNIFPKSEQGWYITNNNGGIYLHVDGQLKVGAGKSAYFKTEIEAKKALNIFIRKQQ